MNPRFEVGRDRRRRHRGLVGHGLPGRFPGLFYRLCKGVAVNTFATIRRGEWGTDARPVQRGRRAAMSTEERDFAQRCDRCQRVTLGTKEAVWSINTGLGESVAFRWRLCQRCRAEVTERLQFAIGERR